MGTTKHRGAFRLAVQHEQWGYHGEIELEVEVLDEGDEIEISIPEDLREWSRGISFGIAYAYDKSTTLSRRAAHVRVIDVRFHNKRDTSEMVMAYVAAHAVWKALNEAPTRLPTLDVVEARFIFPA